MGWEGAMGGGGGGRKDILSILCILSVGEEEDRMAGWTGQDGRMDRIGWERAMGGGGG